MSCITRSLIRWGLIGGLALGGVTLLIGPDRVATGLAQIRSTAQEAVDQVVDDPVALRRQLEQLANEYPRRIEEVTGETAEVDYQIAQLSRDIEIAGRVVAFTSEDLNVLKTRLAKAETEMQTRLTSQGETPAVFIRFEGIRFDIDEAYAEVLRIGGIRTTYKDRMAFDQHQLEMLSEQKERLTEIHQKLQEDFNTYQAQLWTLDRQIDAIQRNDRLIDMMEEQQATLDSYDRYAKVGNLNQIHGKLAELRARQDAQIETLRKVGFRADYENKARSDMDQAEFDTDRVYEEIMKDLNEQTDSDVEATATSRSVAFADPIVIED